MTGNCRYSKKIGSKGVVDFNFPYSPIRIMTSRPSATLQRRPPTPKLEGSSTPPSTAPPPPPIPHKINTSSSASSSTRNSAISPQSSTRRSFGFLHRSKSNDRVQKMKPVVAPTAPELPNLWQANGANAAPSFSKQLLGKDVRDSVDIVSGKYDSQTNGNGVHQTRSQQNLPAATSGNGGYVQGRKSTDSVMGQGYVSSSQVPLSQDPYSGVGASMANRGRFSYASSQVSSTLNSPRRVRRRRDPTPFKLVHCSGEDEMFILTIPVIVFSS